MSTAAPVSTSIIEANLAALAGGNPRLVGLLRETVAREDVSFEPAMLDPLRLSATIEDFTAEGIVARALCSRRDPVAEAGRLVANVRFAENPAVVVVGFGAGYHVAELAARVRTEGIIIVFESDAALLRAVLERIDCSEWIRRTNLMILTETDEGAISQSLQGLEGVLAMGVEILHHPPSKPRLGPVTEQFTQSFTRVMKAVRTSVVTTMVQTEATLRNLLQNIDHYAIGPGIADLKDRFSGRPAIVVSAGPGLERNLHLLSQPGVRDRFVIIAVQTALKTMLARGIKPHYVTALDYHEISRRFYEGLKPEDVTGVELVVEPKVSPAVPIAFPGVVRCAGDPFLDSVLGAEFASDHGSIRSGATVAHLAYYLARHCGCDPVILIGQDLGFSDGQYYAAGAAIHGVWAGELNEFNTLEMLEWQRIVRMRAYLRRETDVLGRPIYTDEQMATYLVQFERDFKADVERGLRVIDATEGGVKKAYTSVTTLAEAIRQWGADPVGAASGAGVSGIATTPASQAPTPQARAAMSRLGRERLFRRGLSERLRELRHDVWMVARQSAATAELLKQMLEHQQDQAKVNALIERVEQTAKDVLAIQPAFGMIQLLNQTGGFNRVRADRSINLDKALTPMQVQRRQIERDIKNVEWIAEAAETLGTMLEDSARTVVGGERQTRDPSLSPDKVELLRPDHQGAARRTIAAVTMDAGVDGLGRPRDLGTAIYKGMNPLQLTVARLARSRDLKGIAILCDDVATARRLLGAPPADAKVSFHAIMPGDRMSAAVRAASRSFARSSWRGGLGNLTCYDEVLCAATTRRVLDEAEAESALIVGADWCLVDPALCDALIERYREQPRIHRLTFSQAAPGLCGCVIDRTMLSQIAERRQSAGAFASIGGVLGYVPTSPAVDLIARPNCVPVPAAVRDCGVRAIADSTGVVNLAARGAAGADLLTIAAADCARLLADSSGRERDRADEVVMILGDDQGWMDADAGLAEFDRAAAPGAAVTLRTRGFVADVLEHADWQRIVSALRGRGCGAVHLRTHLRCRQDQLAELLRCGADVISVDLIAATREVYRSLAGRDDFDKVQANLRAILSLRGGPGAAVATGIATPWIVPRLTRRDGVYEQIESFFDVGMMTFNWAVIDPLESAIPGERIAPLPLPAAASERLRRSRVIIGTDGPLVDAPSHQRDLRQLGGLGGNAR